MDIIYNYPKHGKIWLELSIGNYYKGTGLGFRIYMGHLEIWFPYKKQLNKT